MIKENIYAIYQSQRKSQAGFHVLTIMSCFALPSYLLTRSSSGHGPWWSLTLIWAWLPWEKQPGLQVEMAFDFGDTRSMAFQFFLPWLILQMAFICVSHFHGYSQIKGYVWQGSDWVQFTHISWKPSSKTTSCFNLKRTYWVVSEFHVVTVI